MDEGSSVVWKQSYIKSDHPRHDRAVCGFAADDSGKFTINRTQHYVIDEFDRLYDGKLHKLATWKQWVTLVDLLDDKVAGAFAGSVNLHEYESEIDELAAVYEQLRSSISTPTRRNP